ncbi:host cell division inhibitor Icd-like protein [Klebsiella variicola]|uniref:host cell division inhibitor Icd-like protein n=1 Tax=Klebsiella variicola TaxID=244366 RepID=UPI003119CAF2
MAHKTKAAIPGRQCNNTKHIQDTRLAAGGQSLGAPEITRTAPLARLGGMSNNGYTPFGSTNFSVYQQGTAMAYTPQPFGSMPRLSSSRRSKRFIQPERLSSPSSFIAIFNLSNRSASNLSCTANLSFLLSSVDIVNLKANNELKVTMYANVIIKTTPRAVRAAPGRLTKPLKEVTIMAELQHTQTHPKFTWLFLATPKSHPDCSPVVLRFDTDTEENARAAFPGWEMVFAAKIRAEAPCRVAFFDYNTRRGWAFDSASDREVVGHD